MDKMKYINSNGQSVELGTGNILVGSNNARDYEWNYTTLNETIAAFTRGQTKKKLTLLFYGSNCYELANSVCNIFDYDVIHLAPGKLYIGEYYIEGYFYASEKDVHKTDICKIEFEFVSNTGTWIKEKTYKYRYKDEESATGDLDFPFDFPFDYFIGGNSNNLNNESMMASEFVLTIYGNSTLTSVNINIGGNSYVLNTNAGDNEYITVDSKKKTIVKTGSGGATTNLFNYRSRGYNIFQKIAAGNNSVAWDDDFDFDITVYEERSEPVWT